MSRWQVESSYIGRYLGSGLFNTLVGFAVIFLAMWAGLSPSLANVSGYAAGFILGFVLSKKMVFRSNGSFVKESMRYLIAFFVAFALNFIVLHIALDKFGLAVILAQIVAAIVYTLTMYALTRFYVFSPGLASKSPHQ
ncbi:GtrA family protein [Pseudomonas sp. Irchel 3A7]|uniref:GtrA family protein n=1 Tax=Pseudomonas sp. Irchel 3A7 TaxID=2008913 RepID=UPI000BA3DC6F|nr:GtrA family protein [Pseudomonas sp. Irchel 3A7]